MDHPLSTTYGARFAYFLQSADDYHRQRQRISRKLARTKKFLGLTTRDTKNYKDKEKISKISSEQYNGDIRYGDVLLYEAERDMLYAEETKLLLDVHATKPKQRFLVSKCKKAVEVSKKLLAVAADEKDQFRQLELLTYYAFTYGSLAVAKKRWDHALNSFSIARCALQCLYEYQTDVENKEVYLDLMDKVVDPVLMVSVLDQQNVRSPDLVVVSRGQAEMFADSTPHLSKAVEIIGKIDPELVKIPADVSETVDAEQTKQIKWTSYTARIKSEEESKAIAKAKASLKSVDQKDPASYDDSLLAYRDAIGTHNLEMQRDEEFATDDDKQEGMIVRTYLEYNYMMLQIQRDVSILNGIDKKLRKKKNAGTRYGLLENARDTTRVLEGISTTLGEVKELPGVSNDDDLTSTLESLETYFRIQKVVKLANAYLAVNKTNEALVLLEKAADVSERTPDLKTNLDGNLPTPEEFQAFKAAVAAELRKVHVLAVYNEQQKQYKSQGYIIDNADKFPEIPAEQITSRIAPLTVDIVPANVKPVLFDTAFNYIQYAPAESSGPGSATAAASDYVPQAPKEDAQEEQKDAADAKKKGGFFGFFGR